MNFDLQSAAIILIDKGKVLMQLRDNKPTIDSPNCWCIPGGGVEGGEDEKKGAQRELLEETGCSSSSPVFLYSDIYKTEDGRRVKRNIFYEIYDGKQEIKCCERQKNGIHVPGRNFFVKCVPRPSYFN